MGQLNKFKNRDAPASELLLVSKEHFHWLLHKIVKLLAEKTWHLYVSKICKKSKETCVK